jgi:hypothetical protein
MAGAATIAAGIAAMRSGATSRRAAALARDHASIPAAIADATDRRGGGLRSAFTLSANHTANRASFETERFGAPDRLHNRRSQWW